MSIYICAGYPRVDLTAPLIEAIAAAGADLIEVGMPYSDPLADGPVIQRAGAQALAQGMSLEQLFADVRSLKGRIDVPLIWMGYFNPLLQFGPERFLDACVDSGFEGLIIPDLPPEVYSRQYQKAFEARDLSIIFLVTPQTPESRIRRIDELSNGFVYLVASASITGRQSGIGKQEDNYLRRVADMNLRNPLLVGFGIHDRESFEAASRHTRGAIIGSAFLKHIGAAEDPVQAAANFVRSIR